MDREGFIGMGERELRRLLRTAETRDQAARAHAALESLRAERLHLLSADLDAANRAFAELSDRLEELTAAFDQPESAGELRTVRTILDGSSRVFAAIREPVRLRRAEEMADMPVDLDDAETGGSDPGRAPGSPATAPVAREPEPLLPPRNSRDFDRLRDEYARLFAAAEPRPDRVGALAFYLERIERHRPRYEAAAAAAGGSVPWYVIACIHALESSFDFNTHLFNGDPLTGRTVHVPAGHPVADPADGVRYRWEESAEAAIRHRGLDRATDWSLPRTLHRLEGYNGFGYRRHGVPTPYLWSFSTLYERGRFVADHRFDPDAESRQAGAAVIIKELSRKGAIRLAGHEAIDVDDARDLPAA